MLSQMDLFLIVMLNERMEDTEERYLIFFA